MPSDLKDETSPRASAELKGKKRQASATVRAILAGIMVATGAVIGAGAVGFTRPAVQIAPASPIAISSLASGNIVTVKGKVAEIYGDKFVLSDPSGRALVETGPSGEGSKLVASGEVIGVQGRFENGSIHAAYLILADGKVEALAPSPPRPPHDWLHRLIGPR